MHTHIHTHTLGGRAPDILQSAMGAGETVMDYRHIWAVISRSRIPPAFSRRQKSCIMVSHRRPGTPGCIMPCQRACVRLVITGFTTQRRIKQSSKVFWLLCNSVAEKHGNSLRLFADFFFYTCNTAFIIGKMMI